MRPDMTGVQKIDTYTIGLATDPIANALLAHTAANGNGIYASSFQTQELEDAMVAAIDDIIVKAQAFTAATVPASRATDGNNFFASYFVPNNTAAYWEGHLKQFEYNAKGEVLDKPVPPATVGVCAVDDPVAPAQCQVGRLKVELSGYWDAANEIPSAAETGSGIRKLLVSAYTTAPPTTPPATPTTFNTTNMTAALMNITETAGALTTLIASYAAAGSTAGITTAENLADAVARYVRGCALLVLDDLHRSRRRLQAVGHLPLESGGGRAAQLGPARARLQGVRGPLCPSQAGDLRRLERRLPARLQHRRVGHQPEPRRVQPWNGRRGVRLHDLPGAQEDARAAQAGLAEAGDHGRLPERGRRLVLPDGEQRGRRRYHLGDLAHGADLGHARGRARRLRARRHQSAGCREPERRQRRPELPGLHVGVPL